jgi:hypothetical protein
MTGPYYVQIGEEPAVHKASCQFFNDWCLARARQVAKSVGADRDAMRYHRAAIAFWQRQLDASN